MTCDRTSFADAYFDGEGASVDRAVFASHLSGCPACRARLSELGAVSTALSTLASGGLSGDARRRLYRRIDDLTDRPLLRLEWSVSGIAAAILIGCTVWSALVSSGKPAAAVPPWVGAQVTVDSATPASAWYLTENHDTAEFGQ